jgi:hypothetical protein
MVFGNGSGVVKSSVRFWPRPVFVKVVVAWMDHATTTLTNTANDPQETLMFMLDFS